MADTFDLVDAAHSALTGITNLLGQYRGEDVDDGPLLGALGITCALLAIHDDLIEIADQIRATREAAR